PEVELVFCGQLLMDRIEHARIRYLGFQSAAAVGWLLRHAAALAAPGPFESLSLAALEAMAVGVPVLANAASDVLVGHCLRSGAGLYYAGREEFDEALALLLSDEALRGQMGRSGRRYV